MGQIQVCMTINFNLRQIEVKKYKNYFLIFVFFIQNHDIDHDNNYFALYNN